jgi:two-component system phosphate regulon sensor histidine kinase PhoR
MESGTGPCAQLSEDVAAKLAELGPLIDVIADGVVIYDTMGTTLRQNASARVLFGLDAQPMAERSLWLDVRDAAGQRLATEALPLMRVGQGEVLTGETAMDLHFTNLNGRTLVVNASGMPLRNAMGDVIGGVVVYRDVTEQVEATRGAEALAGELAAERNWLRQVLAAIPEAVQIVDATGRYVLANRASAALVGFDVTGAAVPESEQESFAVYGTRGGDGMPARPDDLPLRRALGGEGLHGAQLLLRQRGSGRDLPVLANSAPLRDSAGRVVGAVAVFQDITALKELQKQRDDFLAIGSHDLKNALTTIHATSQVLRRRVGQPSGPDDGQLAAGLDTIIRNVARMADQINEMLDSAYLEMGQSLHLDLQPTDLTALLARLVAEQDQASERHSVRLVAPEGALVGRYDAARLERVMRNLLNNAINYSPDGGLVEVTLSSEGEPGSAWATIHVRDQGLGIPATELERVFERFVRGSNVVGRIKGTGIGLAGVRQIVEQHGGTVALASAEGVGTTATIRLPHRPAPTG